MSLTARQRLAIMSPEDLARFRQFTADGDNRRAMLTLEEVELLIAIADEP